MYIPSIFSSQGNGWSQEIKEGFSRKWSVISDRKMLLVEIACALFLTVLACIHWPSALVAACLLPVVIWIERSKATALVQENQQLREGAQTLIENNLRLTTSIGSERAAIRIARIETASAEDSRERIEKRFTTALPEWVEANEILRQEKESLKYQLEDLARKLLDAQQAREEAREETSRLVGENAVLLLRNREIKTQYDTLKGKVEIVQSNERASYESQLKDHTSLTCEVEQLQLKVVQLERALALMRQGRNVVLESQLINSGSDGGSLQSNSFLATLCNE